MAKVARHLRVVMDCRQEFEALQSLLGHQRHYVVHLQNHTYKCCGSQLSRMPCIYVLAYILHINVNLVDYVDFLLTKETYLFTYFDAIRLISNEINQLAINIFKFSLLIRYTQPRRLKKKRNKEPNRMLACKRRFTSQYSICNILGYNRKSCPSNEVRAFIHSEYKYIFLCYSIINFSYYVQTIEASFSTSKHKGIGRNNTRTCFLLL